MLDPLTAISLASAIVQFADFGTKVIVSGVKIYRSAHGALEENDDIEKIVTEVHRLTEGPLLNPSRFRSTSLEVNQEAEQKLYDLAESCNHVAKELLEVLQDLKVKAPQGLQRGWESLQKACKSLAPWNQEKILLLEKRLRSIQEQINQRILIMMSEDQSRVYKLLDRLANDQINQLRKDIAEAVERNLLPWNSDALSQQAVALKLSTLNDIASQQKILDVIRSLDSNTRTVRFSSIPEPHAQTFDWVFDATQASTPPCTFKEWIESSNGIYWITGKPGSGKSTLMKSIVKDRRTEKCLRKWAGESQLAVGSYFFWNAGEMLQKSIIGLLRSLLYDILNKCQDLVEKICPLRVYSFGLSSADWTESEIISSLERICHQSLSMKFCFFVDGLDEYDGYHMNAIQVLKRLAAIPNIKLCFSSRPWNVFISEFTHNPNYAIETMTKADIHLYVTTLFAMNERFFRVAERDPRCKTFTRQIIENAQGVFLWVNLVVRELLRGLHNDDDVEDLQKRFNYLPKTLEELYEHAFDRIDGFYKKDAARWLQVLECAIRPLPLAAFFSHEFADENVERLFKKETRTIQVADLERRARAWRKQISARCQDFLVIFPAQKPGHWSTLSVDFQHTTVMGFLKTPYMKRSLATLNLVDFRPRIFLMKGICAQLRFIFDLEGELGQQMRRLPSIFTLVDEFLEYSWQLEKADNVMDITLMDEFERIARRHFKSEGFTEEYAASKGRIISYDSHTMAEALLESVKKTGSLLEFAVQSDLQLYVAGVLDSQPMDVRISRSSSLLNCALNSLMLQKTSFNKMCTSVGMVRLLIQRGASPCDFVRNQWKLRGRPTTVLQLFLRDLQQQKLAYNRSQYHAASLLVESCQPLHSFNSWYIPIGQGNFPRRLTLIKIIGSIFEPYDADQLGNTIKSSKWFQKQKTWMSLPMVATLAPLSYHLGDVINLTSRYFPFLMQKVFPEEVSWYESFKYFVTMTVLYQVVRHSFLVLLKHLISFLLASSRSWQVGYDLPFQILTAAVIMSGAWFVFCERSKKFVSTTLYPNRI